MHSAELHGAHSELRCWFNLTTTTRSMIYVLLAFGYWLQNRCKARTALDSADKTNLGLYSLSGKTSYRKISWSLEAARFGFKLFQSLWNLAGTLAALLPRCQSNFRAIQPLQHPISRPRDFTIFGGKTSYRLVNRGHGSFICHFYTLCTLLMMIYLYWSSPNFARISAAPQQLLAWHTISIQSCICNKIMLFPHCIGCYIYIDYFQILRGYL